MPAIAASSLRVLIVDDDPAVTRFLTAALADLGVHDVTTADNGAAALEVDVGLESGIGLIVSDLQMPKLDGIAYLRHLKNLEYRGAVLLMSGADSRLLKAVEGLATSLGLNVLGALAKPIRRVELAEALGRLGARTSGFHRVAGVAVSADELRNALETGLVDAWFQPQAEARSRRLLGAEALARWKHPEKGFIPPSVFIPLAEETGLIDALGAWILHEACAEAARWPGHVRIAVNLSPAQFRKGDLVDVVTSALACSGLAAERLDLEITESVLLQKSEANLAILHVIRRLGVSIVLDDFGTGYSSLRYLHLFPFDKIKIDRSFVRELATRADCAAIVCAITGLARSLGIVTTAEGVETEEQFALVRAAGCGEVQGFLFGRPGPAARLDWLSLSAPAAVASVG